MHQHVQEVASVRIIYPVKLVITLIYIEIKGFAIVIENEFHFCNDFSCLS